MLFSHSDRQHPTNFPQLRHRLEQPIVVSCALVSILLVILIGFCVTVVLSNPDLAVSLDAGVVESASGLALLLVFWPMTVALLRATRSAAQHQAGITVSNQQLGYVQEIAEEVAARFRIATIPTVVVVFGLRPSAITTPGIRKHTIAVSNMLVETTVGDPPERAALRFALAREMAHIALGHRSYRREIATMILTAIPWLKTLIERVECYSIDRYAAWAYPQDAACYFGLESVGKFLWTDMDFQVASNSAGGGGLLEAWAARLLYTPPLPWRIRALGDFGLWNDAQQSSLHPSRGHGNVWMPPRQNR